MSSHGIRGVDVPVRSVRFTGTTNTAAGKSYLAAPSTALKASAKPQPQSPPTLAPRVIVLGAGSRGNAYAQCIMEEGLARVVAVAERDKFKRETFAQRYVLPAVGVSKRQPEAVGPPTPGEAMPRVPAQCCFEDWTEWVAYERSRRRISAGSRISSGGGSSGFSFPRTAMTAPLDDSMKTAASAAAVPAEGGNDDDGLIAVDAAFICLPDEQHRAALEALGPLGLHVLCEKPVATSVDECVAVLRALRQPRPPSTFMTPPLVANTVFAVGHVLRYAPHNLLLRRLLLEERIIGDVLSAVHTEPVGHWHFAHSYVRGNWRRSDTSAPSLLTKCCHDIDLLMWLFCDYDYEMPLKLGMAETGHLKERIPHMPSTVSSTGARQLFRKSRKPIEAGNATNCLHCPAEDLCNFSAKKIYIEKHGLDSGNTGWPVNVVMPEIEDYCDSGGKLLPNRKQEAHEALLERLAEDYDATMGDETVKRYNWFGRCVYESDNDVMDDQTVTITWDEEPLPDASVSPDNTDDGRKISRNHGDDHGHGYGTGEPAGLHNRLRGRGAKQVTLHMVASSQRMCERVSHFYGTEGEIETDSHVITVTNFATGKVTRHHVGKESELHHGGGDKGLTRKFLTAVDKVMNHSWEAERAQKEIIGCTVLECMRSHAIVFAAEEARRSKTVIHWRQWWDQNVEQKL